MSSVSETGFRGMIFGVEYLDRTEFEKAARAAGWRSGMSDRTGDWRVGLAVKFKRTDTGEVLDGQVWSKGSNRGTVVLALTGAHYASVATSTGGGKMVDSRGQDLDIYGAVLT